VPGITAALGAAARLGVPLTGRGSASRLQLVTGHSHGGGLPANIDWRSVADPAATTAVYMPLRTLDGFVAEAMRAGLDERTPAVAVVRATCPDEQRIAAPVAELASEIRKVGARGPVIVMIGGNFARLLGSSVGLDNVISEALPLDYIRDRWNIPARDFRVARNLP
jgi:uroporphyrin-III C-methyltransferase/precorrin-2 dehydrogenase/sirohydrochlorin ferrochelatase